MYSVHDRINELTSVLEAIDNVQGVYELKSMRRTLCTLITRAKTKALQDDLENALGDSLYTLNNALEEARHKINQFEQMYPEYRVHLEGLNNGGVHAKLINERKRHEHLENKYTETEFIRPIKM